MAADDGIEHIVATPHANERFHYNRQHLVSHLEYLRVLVGRTPRLAWAAISIFLTTTCRMFWFRRNATPSKAAITCWWS